MKCLVTAGPTFEPLDEVRRLTNFSTGRLGSQLAAWLAARGHDVTLLLGHYATWRGGAGAAEVRTFTTANDLSDQLHRLAAPEVGAVFHAAAVGDFCLAGAYERLPDGRLAEIKESKIASRRACVLLELKPAPKIIASLRDWYPSARLIGWKYELEGGREAALAGARRQLTECRTDACVVNGRAYGEGFGLARPDTPDVHCADQETLFDALAGLL